ncbi:MAG: response regulator [Calditrichaeota bacterium]|nr:response regulator [Calditrichota bacterium]MCB9369158.1 response regulator [Calditrichota bacterium]
MTILSVDDSTTIRRIVKRSCEELGHTVLEAADGAAALATLAEKSSEVSLVILDWNMPGMTGLEVLKAVKSDPRTKNIVVMMLTSEADMNFVKEALAAGAQNYLTKPFDQKMLALKIQESMAMISA